MTPLVLVSIGPSFTENGAAGTLADGVEGLGSRDLTQAIDSVHRNPVIPKITTHNMNRSSLSWKATSNASHRPVLTTSKIAEVLKHTFAIVNSGGAMLSTPIPTPMRIGTSTATTPHPASSSMICRLLFRGGHPKTRLR